jgi:hypothetical protein
MLPARAQGGGQAGVSQIFHVAREMPMILRRPINAAAKWEEKNSFIIKNIN